MFFKTTKVNLHANRQKVEDPCLRLLVETFNKVVNHPTNAGLYAYFELENINKEANNKFIELLRNAGYMANCFIVKGDDTSAYCKYAVWVDKPATPDN